MKTHVIADIQSLIRLLPKKVGAELDNYFCEYEDDFVPVEDFIYHLKAEIEYLTINNDDKDFKFSTLKDFNPVLDSIKKNKIKYITLWMAP